MKVSHAIQSWFGYHKLHSKKNILRAYQPTITKFGQHFEERELQSLSSDEILSFLTHLTKGNKQLTKHTRYSYLSSFFNFIKNNNDPSLQNPCDNQMMRKLFKNTEIPQWKILEKDVVDEIIFRTIKPRNRLILELMARGGMRNVVGSGNGIKVLTGSG
jgi:site-specific recombinase XerD